MAGVAEHIVAVPMIGWVNGFSYDPAVHISNINVVHREGQVPIVSLAFIPVPFPFLWECIVLGDQGEVMTGILSVAGLRLLQHPESFFFQSTAVAVSFRVLSLSFSNIRSSWFRCFSTA